MAGTLTAINGPDRATPMVVDTSDNLNIISGLQKAYVVNGSILKIADFSNHRLDLNGAMTRYPMRGQLLTQAVSGAVMSIDYIDSTNNYVYGFVISGTFDTSNTVDAPGMQPTATLVPSNIETAEDGPLGYDWKTYPDAYNVSLDVTESYGSLPAKCYLAAWYRGRAVLAGNPADPFQWYMSRQLNPFDYAYVANDAQTPVAGGNGDAGKIGDIVRALIPFHDDYMLFGCASSMHYMQGDPSAGGSLHSIDDFTGIFGAMSWCFDGIGDLYMFGNDGISVVRKDTLVIDNVSRFSIPELLEDEGANPETHRITLGYDKKRDGVVIAITVLADGSNSNYFYDIKAAGFFPETYPVECGVYSQLYYPANIEANSDLLVGGRDGYVRKFSDSAKNDDVGPVERAISSECLMPLVNTNEEQEDGQGRLNTMTVTLSGGSSGGSHPDSDGVTLDIHVNDDAETLVEAIQDGDTPIHTVDIIGSGRQNRLRKKARGKFLGVMLKNSTISETWALGKLSIGLKNAGRIK